MFTGKFRKFHRKIAVLETLFNKAAGFGPATLLKIFPGTLAKIFRTFIF